MQLSTRQSNEKNHAELGLQNKTKVETTAFHTDIFQLMRLAKANFPKSGASYLLSKLEIF